MGDRKLPSNYESRGFAMDGRNRPAAQIQTRPPAPAPMVRPQAPSRPVGPTSPKGGTVKK